VRLMPPVGSPFAGRAQHVLEILPQIPSPMLV
jgi:hypothetical protein